MEEERQHINLVGPTILIGLGVIILLNNMGYLNWNLWDIVRLWPVLLIAAGLELLIGRRSIWGSLIAAVIVLAMIVGGVWLLNGVGETVGTNVLEIREPLGDIETARVELSPAVGSLTVDALSDSGNFVEGTVRHRNRERIDQDFTAETHADLSLKTRDGSFTWPGNAGSSYSWHLSFHPEVELVLDANLGAGQSDFDLSKLQIDEAQIDFGVGQTTVRLPESGELDVTINGAIGAIVIEVPEGMAVRVRTDTAIVGHDVPGDYDRSDDTYTSPGYDEADNRADIHLALAIGSVSITEDKGQ